MITLYDYYRSSSSFRVRIALNLKQVPYQLKQVHLVRDGGEQFSPEYLKLNPIARVPTLVDGDFVLTQSLAIIAYLDDKYPQQKIMPDDFELKAKVNAFAQVIACDIHPVDNLSVLKYLKSEFGVSDAQKTQWVRHWIVNGFKALEKMLEDNAGEYCFGGEITLADLCLVPQVYNANRFEVDMNAFPNIQRVCKNAMKLDAFSKADPDCQPEH